MEFLFQHIPSLPVNAAGDYGDKVDYLLYLVTYIITPWVILTFGLILLFCFLYRKQEGKDSLWVDSHETLFTIGSIPIPRTAIIEVPTLCVLGLDLWIFASSVAAWGELKIDQPKTEHKIQVIAKQFGWDFYYPGDNGELDTTIEREILSRTRDGKLQTQKQVRVQSGDDGKSAGTLYVPAGKPVSLFIESKDVIHSLFIPNLRFKQDAVPGRNIDTWTKAEKLTRPAFREGLITEQLNAIASTIDELESVPDKLKAFRERVEKLDKPFEPEKGVPSYTSIRDSLRSLNDQFQQFDAEVLPSKARNKIASSFDTAASILSEIIKDQQEYGGFFKHDSFEIVCAELCGNGHSGMTANLVVLPPDVYKKCLQEEVY